jgi:hypothetical protein
MPILRDNPELEEALRDEMTPKFLATRSPDGLPNVVPVISLQPADDQADVIFFGNFLLRKTIRNLEGDVRVGILVITTSLQGWCLSGDFLEFQRTGPYVERVMSGSLLRYNAYTGIRNAGVIRLQRLTGAFRLPRLKVLTDYVMARIVGALSQRRAPGGVHIPRPVREAYGRLTAVKVMAWIGDDGYPAVVPCLSLQPLGTARLGCWSPSGLPLPPQQAGVATGLLTLDAVSYQTKGRWQGGQRAGTVRVEEVYAGGPPLPGGRIA